MYNELFHIGRFTVYGYGLMIAIGILAAIFLADYRGKKQGLNSDTLWSLFIWVILMGAIGCKVLYIIVEIKAIIADPSILLDISNGFVIYGGIIFGILTIFFFCKIKKLPFLVYFDLLVPSVAVAQGLGRLGCFLAGCCYGRECDAFFCITFKNSAFAPNGVSLIPTQLIMFAGDMLIAIALIAIAKNNKVPGKIASYYMIFYGIGRFAVEFLRDDPRGAVGIFSTSQFVSIFIVAAGALLLWVLSRTKRVDNLEHDLVTEEKQTEED